MYHFSFFLFKLSKKVALWWSSQTGFPVRPWAETMGEYLEEWAVKKFCFLPSWVGEKPCYFLLCYLPMSLHYYSHSTPLLTLLVTESMGFFPSYQASHNDIYDTSRVSYSLTQFWHCISRESIRLHRLRASPIGLAPTQHCRCQS